LIHGPYVPLIEIHGASHADSPLSSVAIPGNVGLL
jgi:hypothetical protein